MRETVTDHAASLASKASYAVGATGFAAGMTLQDWLAVLGAVMMVATFFVNLYFKRRHLDIELERQRRAKREECEIDNAS